MIRSLGGILQSIASLNTWQSLTGGAERVIGLSVCTYLYSTVWLTGGAEEIPGLVHGHCVGAVEPYQLIFKSFP
jgi:hypothetical protein